MDIYMVLYITYTCTHTLLNSLYKYAYILPVVENKFDDELCDNGSYVRITCDI